MEQKFSAFPESKTTLQNVYQNSSTFGFPPEISGIINIRNISPRLESFGILFLMEWKAATYYLSYSWRSNGVFTQVISSTRLRKK